MTPSLPIDVVPNRTPMVFRWKCSASGLGGTVMQQMEGCLPAPVEGAVANLIAMVKDLQADNKRLYEEIERLRPAEGVLVPKVQPAPAKVKVK